jgi:hypothetical protein
MAALILLKHQESETRYGAYLETLGKYGLQSDESMVFLLLKMFLND